MDELTQLKKLPPWAWGVAVVGGIALYLYSRRTTSTPATAATPTASNVAGQQALAGSINTITPQCTQYPIPNCDPTLQTLIWEMDVEGCPQPVCQLKSAQGVVDTSNTPTTTVPSTQTGTTCYRVVSGDNLSSIASRYGTTWQQLVTWNALPNGCNSGFPQLLVNPNLIYSGWNLRVR